MLIYSMYKLSEKDSDVIPYSLIKWLARILWTCLLPLVLTAIFVKVVKKNITNKDADESVDSANKTMMIYGELSEFEWRNEHTIYSRIYTLIAKNAEMKKFNSITVVDLDDIVATLIIGNNFFCQMRQETAEEFVSRAVDKYLNEHQNVISEENLVSVKDVFVQQFKLITKNGRGDLFKEFYLGRSLMFLKINGGNSKQKPKQKEMIPEGT